MTTEKIRPVFESNLKNLELLGRGKVRDMYKVNEDSLLIVTSDRISAFDVVLKDPIPGKGIALTAISNFWFEKLSKVIPNHLTNKELNKIDISNEEFDLIKDDARFSNKTNFLYLPPENLNGSQLGTYTNTQQSLSKILVKNSVNNLESVETAINDSIESIDVNPKIQKKYFEFTKKKLDPKYLFQIYGIDSIKSKIEKLAIIDHGDNQFIDKQGRRKFRRVFSAGKLYRIEKNVIEPGYLQSDQQIRIQSYFGFANIFTISFEE